MSIYIIPILECAFHLILIDNRFYKHTLQDHTKKNIFLLFNNFKNLQLIISIYYFNYENAF